MSTFLVRCGISTYANYYLSALKKASNYDITVLAEERDVGGKDDSQPDIVPYVECWNRYIGFDRMLKEIKKLQPDEIHFNHEFGLQCLNPDMMLHFLDTLKQIKSMDVKTVFTYHSVPIQSHNFFTYYFTNVSQFSDKSVFHTEEARQQAINLGLKGESSVIKHGVLIPQLYDREKARKELNIPSDKRVIMSMGWFGGLKGVMELIDMMPEILKQMPSILFCYVGGLHPATADFGRGYMKDCFKRILELGLKDKFIITGFIEEADLPKYYAVSDLAVLNYQMSGYHSASGCSAKLVGAKVPIITTSGTHRNDELTDGVNCVKVPYGDKKAMIEAIFKVLKGKELREEIIRNAYIYAEANRWDVVSKRYMREIYA